MKFVFIFLEERTLEIKNPLLWNIYLIKISTYYHEQISLSNKKENSVKFPYKYPIINIIAFITYNYFHIYFLYFIINKFFCQIKRANKN